MTRKTVAEQEGKERLPVFVYGTLRPGEKNYPAYLQGMTDREMAATAEGELFFVADGGYPFMIPGGGTVRGELIEIDPARYDQLLRRLDELEEYNAGNEVDSVYLRRRATIRLEDGSEAEGWIYYWNCPQIRGEKIESGDFKKRSIAPHRH